MAYVKYRDVPYQRDVLLSADRLDYIEDGLVEAASGSEGIAIEDVDGLQSALDDKADSSALTSGLAGKANTSHTHTIANVTGLQAAIDGKAATTHTHTVAQVTGLQAILTDLEDRLAGLEGA